MYKQALDLLSQALEVWPTANVKFHYLEKLLSTVQPAGQNKDPLSAVAQGLDVMNKIMEKQPHLFVRNNVQYIIQVFLTYPVFLKNPYIPTLLEVKLYMHLCAVSHN